MQVIVIGYHGAESINDFKKELRKWSKSALRPVTVGDSKFLSPEGKLKTSITSILAHPFSVPPLKSATDCC